MGYYSETIERVLPTIRTKIAQQGDKGATFTQVDRWVYNETYTAASRLIAQGVLGRLRDELRTWQRQSRPSDGAGGRPVPVTCYAIKAA